MFPVWLLPLLTGFTSVKQDKAPARNVSTSTGSMNVSLREKKGNCLDHCQEAWDNENCSSNNSTPQKRTLHDGHGYGGTQSKPAGPVCALAS